jgi:hypothetical protein
MGMGKSDNLRDIKREESKGLYDCSGRERERERERETERGKHQMTTSLGSG